MDLVKYSKGGWVDEAVPDLSHYVDQLPDGFERWLGGQLGMYRLLGGDGRETKGENVRALSEIMRRLDAVLEIDDEALPPSAEALLTEAAYRGWGNDGVSALCGFRRLRQEAVKARAACEVALDKVQETPTQTGRYSNVRAERLLIDVTERLSGANLSARLQSAVEILALCRVQVPETHDEENLMRIYRRAKKRKSDELKRSCHLSEAGQN